MDIPVNTSACPDPQPFLSLPTYRTDSFRGRGPADSDSSSDNESSHSDNSSDDNWKRRKTTHHNLNDQKRSNEEFQMAASAFSHQLSTDDFRARSASEPIIKRGPKNNIWSNVLMEDTMRTDVLKFGLEERDDDCERGVEQYATITRRQTNEFRNSRKRRMTNRFKGRLPPRKPDIIFDPEDTIEDIAKKLADELREPKMELLIKVVENLGVTKSVDLLRETEDVECSGGMLTVQGDRRRTPGGVYLQLLKADETIPKEKKNSIFGDERKAFNEDRNKRRAKKRRKLIQKTLAAKLALEAERSLESEMMETTTMASTSSTRTVKIKDDAMEMTSQHDQLTDESTNDAPTAYGSATSRYSRTPANSACNSDVDSASDEREEGEVSDSSGE